MSYQVLARKWRPRNFDQIVGQGHVVRALRNALSQQRLHHAYLFTGTRGVGKTTLARVLARAVNCEQGITDTPCGECSVCTAIDDGRFIDLIEVDAASRTKVEDTRELLDNVQYAPTVGRFKVYLIDEVHMLSKSSFNALLKTLEEPPEHIKFLLATTDPQKLPITVLSRCLQFNLTRVPQAAIEQHLAQVVASEAVPTDPQALGMLARLADGSLRDALSLLDQAIAFGAGKLAAEQVSQMVGGTPVLQLDRLLEALGKLDAAAAIEALRATTNLGADPENVLGELLAALHAISIAHLIPEAVGELSFDPLRLQDWVTWITPEDAQLYYDIGLAARRQLAYAPDPHEGVEMALLKMLVFRPADPPGTTAEKPQVAAATSSTVSQPSFAVAPLPVDSDDMQALHWITLLPKLGLKGLALELAANCALLEQSDTRMVLALQRDHSELKTELAEQRLAAALSQYMGRSIAIAIQLEDRTEVTPAKQREADLQARQVAAEQLVRADAAVQRLQSELGATIAPGSVRPASDA